MLDEKPVEAIENTDSAADIIGSRVCIVKRVIDGVISYVAALAGIVFKVYLESILIS